MMRICKLGEEILREVAVPVEKVTEDFKQLAADMFETMDQANGVGLACPQIGMSIRMFVVMADDDVRRVFINPQIISTSNDLTEYEEGCLSIPGVYEKIMRPAKVTVQALNEEGKPFTLEAEGLLARVIQHEYDHLDGHVFIDRGDPEFKAKTEKAFEKRAERAKEKAAAKEAKQKKIAAKIAAKEAAKAAKK